MESNDQEEVIVDDLEDNNEEVEENTEEKPAKAKPKRTPQEELEYFEGRAERLRKKLGLKETKVEPPKSTQSDKPNELDYGQMALLRTEGIKGSGELALFKEIMAETGKDVLGVLDSSYFKARLAEFREGQESTNAIPKGKGRSNQTGSTEVDLAYARYQETGQWPDDFETAKKLKDKIVETEKGSASIYTKK